MKHPGRSSVSEQVETSWREVLLQERFRPVLLRYLIPIIVALLLVIFLCLPLVVFRTSGGASEPASVLSWHVDLFFGTNGHGAFEYLTEQKGTDSATTEWARAVVVTFFVDAVLFCLGVTLSVATSVVALYLSLTEERTEISHRVGRIFRVLIGNRGTLIAFYLIMLAPFLFPQLVAGYYSNYLLAATTVEGAPVDPLWIALILCALNVIITLWAKPHEIRYGYHVFRVRRTGSEVDPDAAWRASVAADAAAESGSFRIYGIDRDPQTNISDINITEEVQNDGKEAALQEADPQGEELRNRDLYDGAWRSGGTEPDREDQVQKAEGEAGARGTRSVTAPDDTALTDGDARKADETRALLRELFEDEEENASPKKKHRHKSS